MPGWMDADAIDPGEPEMMCRLSGFPEPLVCLAETEMRISVGRVELDGDGKLVPGTREIVCPHIGTSKGFAN